MTAKRQRLTYPPMPWKERGWRLGLMMLAGVLIFLSFPFTTERDTNLWPLAWVALVPFFEGLRGLRGKQAFWFGALAGLVTNFCGFWWISEVLREFGHLPWYAYWPLTLLNSFYQGLMLAFIGLFLARAAKRRPDQLVPIWQAAAIWTVVEWLFPMIFPWYFANSQYRFLPAIQIAELFGVMSISFVMVAFNAGLHRLWVQRALRPTAGAVGLRPELPRRALIVTFLGTAAVLIYGQIRIGMVDADIASADKVRLGLVEADIGIFEKQAKHLPAREQALTLHRNLLKHQTMSAELEKLGVDLVVWPESSYFPLDDPFIKRSDRMALGLGRGGALVEWVYDPTSDGFLWRPVVEPAALQPQSIPTLAGTAIAALREDLVLVLGPQGHGQPFGPSAGGLNVAGTTLPAGDFTAVALASAPGFSAREDHAKAVVWAAGKGGVLAFGRVGEPLAAVSSGVTQNLNAIAMRTGRDGVAVGDDGIIVEIEREKARHVDAIVSPAAAAQPALVALRAVAWGQVPELGQLALAVGDKGTIAVRLETGWQVERLPGEVDLSAVAFDRRGQPWIGGKGGFIALRSRGVWREARLPNAVDVVALAVDPLGAVLVSDASGAMWQRGETATAWQTAPGEGGVTAIAAADWVQAMPLPRDVRWVRQGTAPLPTLAEFDRDPSAELGEVAEQDRTGIQRGFATPILLGGLTWAPPLAGKDRRQLFNTALLLDQRGRLRGSYDKVFLLAFGEYMPFGDSFPGLYDAFPQAGRFSAGNEVKAFSWRGHKLGIMICYEDIMVDFTGRLADLSPNVIINVTNDAWFGRTAEPWLHLALAAFRAVENRVTLVRSTNTGISAFIDPTGRLVGATRMHEAETLIGDVPMMQGGTLYGLIGNLFAWLLLGGLFAHAGYGWWQRRHALVPETTAASPVVLANKGAP